MNNQELPNNLNVAETPQETSTSTAIQETDTDMDIQDQPTNEPIDMRNPIVKEKDNTASKQDSDSHEKKDKNAALPPTENNHGYVCLNFINCYS